MKQKKAQNYSKRVAKFMAPKPRTSKRLGFEALGGSQASDGNNDGEDQSFSAELIDLPWDHPKRLVTGVRPRDAHESASDALLRHVDADPDLGPLLQKIGAAHNRVVFCVAVRRSDSFQSTDLHQWYLQSERPDRVRVRLCVASENRSRGVPNLFEEHCAKEELVLQSWKTKTEDLLYELFSDEAPRSSSGPWAKAAEAYCFDEGGSGKGAERKKPCFRLRDGVRPAPPERPLEIQVYKSVSGYGSTDLGVSVDGGILLRARGQISLYEGQGSPQTHQIKGCAVAPSLYRLPPSAFDVPPSANGALSWSGVVSGDETVQWLRNHAAKCGCGCIRCSLLRAMPASVGYNSEEWGEQSYRTEGGSAHVAFVSPCTSCTCPV